MWVSLQPALHQFRGPPVQLVRASFDVGEHVDDLGQVVKITTAALPGRGCVRRVVGAAGCPGDHRRFLGRGHFRVGVDGQVAVRAEVTGQQVPDAAGQRVR